MITTTPLPHDPPQKLRGLPKVTSAYNKILLAKTHAVCDNSDENTVLMRVVGYLLLELYAQCHIFSDLPFTQGA